jgi:hypothetical protein
VARGFPLQPENTIMRKMLLAVGLAAIGFAAQPAHADPYRWCAEYGGARGGGGTNCYFRTLGQCRATVSGTGGFCRPNPFYTGGDGRRRRSRR